MIAPTPRWRFTAHDHLTQWYGHVHLLPGHALGQWFCVNRHDGALLWERTWENPNAIFGVADCMIVASQTVSRGPGTWHEGCYGISLLTGEMEWTSNREDGHDSPSYVDGNEVICHSGRVLAASDGKLVRHVSSDEIRAAEMRRFVHPKTDAETLYRSRMAGPVRDRRVRVEGAGWLSHRRAESFGRHRR